MAEGGRAPSHKNMKKKKKGNGAAATPSLKDCANCGAPEGTVSGVVVHKACSRCKITYYCSVKCQKHHWKVGGHQRHCVAPEQRSVANAEAGEAANTKKSDTAAAEEEICAICQYPVSDAPSKPLPCSHVYHIACVEKLRSYDIQQVCPMCRVDLPPGPEQLFEEAMRRWWVLHRRYGQGDYEPWRPIRNADDRREAAEVMRMLTEAAVQGHRGAQNNLGSLYLRAHGVPQSYVMAVEWLRKAADQGNATAQCTLGFMYEQGEGGLPQSDALAVEWFRKAADQGDAQAQCNLGFMYLYGQGLPQSDALAVEWYRKAADQGHANAEFNLGIMYRLGKGGLPQSDALAVEWYRKAADQGVAEAQCTLGCMYKQGEGGLPQSDALAVEWYRKAADQGNAQAQYNLGCMYYHGRGGLPQSDALAVEWWRKAADQGMKEAQHDIGFMYRLGKGGLPQSVALAVEWYRKAADQGVAEAQFNLGNIYENGFKNGKGIKKKDSSEAIRWYRKAAEQGASSGQHHLGKWYVRGMPGQESDVVEGLRWLHLAARQGNEESQKLIASVTGKLRAESAEVADAAVAAATVPRRDHATRRQQLKDRLSKKNKKKTTERPASAPVFVSSPPPTPPLPVGTHVKLNGLRARPEMNWRRGIVKGYKADEDRYEIELDDSTALLKCNDSTSRRYDERWGARCSFVAAPTAAEAEGPSSTTTTSDRSARVSLPI
jgi:TPR repeat protein